MPLVALAVLAVCVLGGAGFVFANSHKAPVSTEDSPVLSVSEGLFQAPKEDSDRFVMTLGGSSPTVVLKGEEYLEAGCHAVDKQKGADVTSKVQVDGSVDTGKVGEYTVTYTVRTDDGAQASKQRTVKVVDDLGGKASGISVLMYHYVYTEDDRPADTSNTNYLLDTKLAAQLKWLKENDYYYPSYQELRGFVDGTHSLPKKSVVLTFDDGQSGFLKHGIPVLEKYQVPATSFIICNRSKSAQHIIEYASEYVSFQSHSYSCHEDGATSIGRGGHIYDLTEEQLTEDQRKAAKMLGQGEAFAYPYGDVSDVAPAALSKAGVQCAFTINYGQVHPGDDPMRLNRVRMFGESSLDGFIAQVKTGA
ncbi:MAG: polysaccharide deacetylase family protein [Coriobacteriia bacterium]|nr:polysaccharide deacetylase family protein [Coriobacteriia bacterium]